VRRKLSQGPQPPRPVQPQMCGTCPFRTDGKAVDLAPGRLDEIKRYLMAGTPHICHHDALHERQETGILCRGGRAFQLQIWHRMGWIEEETDAALHRRLAELGIWTTPEADGAEGNAGGIDG
jgi:hypothetical protein